MTKLERKARAVFAAMTGLSICQFCLADLPVGRLPVRGRHDVVMSLETRQPIAHYRCFVLDDARRQWRKRNGKKRMPDYLAIPDQDADI